MDIEYFFVNIFAVYNLYRKNSPVLSVELNDFFFKQSELSHVIPTQIKKQNITNTSEASLFAPSQLLSPQK